MGYFTSLYVENIPHRAVAVYMYLKDRANKNGTCYPAIGTIAKELKLTVWLSKLCSLDANHIIRHYDITGKKCPLYFVQHEDKWQQFKVVVTNYK